MFKGRRFPVDNHVLVAFDQHEEAFFVEPSHVGGDRLKRLGRRSGSIKSTVIAPERCYI